MIFAYFGIKPVLMVTMVVAATFLCFCGWVGFDTALVILLIVCNDEASSWLGTITLEIFNVGTIKSIECALM